VTTALSIITAALQELGVAETGQSIDSDDAQTCLNALNVLADAWLLEPGYAFKDTMVSATLASSTQSLTIGPSMSLDCARPIRLEDPGCYVSVGTLDFPMRVVDRPTYNDIVLKSVTGPWPLVCMYDEGSPTGNVYFWPLGACTVNLMVMTPIRQFASLSTVYTLTPGFERAFKFALMEEVAGIFGRQLTPVQLLHSRQAKRLLKRSNFSVPELACGNDQPLPNVYAIRGG
jgi:hypothetical protein